LKGSAVSLSLFGHQSDLRVDIAPFVPDAAALSGDLPTAAYGSDLPPTLISQSSLWVHGHTQSSHDYTVLSETGSFRVLCNPRGYSLRRGVGQFENGRFVAGLKVCV